MKNLEDLKEKLTEEEFRSIEHLTGVNLNNWILLKQLQILIEIKELLSKGPEVSERSPRPQGVSEAR